MTFVITLKNVNEPGKGGHFPFTGFEPSGQDVGSIGVPLPLLSLPDLSPLPDPVDDCKWFFFAYDCCSDVKAVVVTDEIRTIIVSTAIILSLKYVCGSCKILL